jgi:hypothetical protein
MTNTQFYEYLDAGALTAIQLKHTWQYALAIKVCPDDVVEPLILANPKIAAEYARQEAVFDALDAPNALAVAVADVDEAQALALIAAAPPDVRAEYAAGLALAEYSQEQIMSQYRQLILGEP